MNLNTNQLWMGFERWGLAILAFVVSVTALFTLWRIFYHRLSVIAAKTTATWDDELLTQIRGPAHVLIWIGSFAIALQISPHEVRNHPFVHYGAKIFIVLGGGWILERLINVAISSRILLTAITPTSRNLINTLVRIFIFSVCLLIILDTIGISITPILTSLGVGSVVIALALQDTLNNFFSGIYIMVDQPIRIGDSVKLDQEVEGIVDKIGWRSTHIQLPSNNTVVIPNSKIASAKLTNFNLPDRETAVVVQATVNPSNDLEVVENTVKEVSREVLARVAGAVKSFEPLVRFNAFGTNGVDFSIILRAQHHGDTAILKHELIKALNHRFNKDQISMITPQKVLEVSKERTV